MSDSVEMASLLKGLNKLTVALQRTNKALLELAASNQAMADAMYAGEHEDAEEGDHGSDMAGNPIRVT